LSTQEYFDGDFMFTGMAQWFTASKLIKAP
jgi:hypothetical protein